MKSLLKRGEGNKGATGGAIIADMLQKEGVSKLFGIIDGTYTHFFARAVEKGIQLITPRHETTALHMAGAYARLTGKLGVAMASNGPGVANALPGVAVENAEGNRVLLITSSRRVPIAYPDRGGTYQCFDQVGVISQMAKWSCVAPSMERIPELLRMGLRKCWQGRPGVVHLDVPENLMNGETKPVPLWEPSSYRRVDPLPPAAELVDQAATMLVESLLPMIHAGSAVIHAQAYGELKELAHLLHAPVTTSWAARGVLPEDDELAFAMIHIKANNSLRNAADLVLCLGARLGETDWWGKAPYWAPPDQQKLIQVDIDDEALGRTRPMDLGVAGDVKLFLKMLIQRLKRREEAQDLEGRRTEVAKLRGELSKDRAKLDEKLTDKESPMITAQVAPACQEVFADDSIVVFDGGNSAVWANFYHQATVPGTLLTTNHMGHLGAGQGQALGAAIAHPDRTVYCILGDGAMGFHPQEIETAIRNNLKIVFLVVADKQWGMVKINQSFALRPLKTMWKKSLAEGETINTELGEIAWDKLGEAMGAHGERVADPGELVPALKRCVAADKCAVVHVEVDSTKHMWAPGLLHFKAMHQEPKGK